MTRLRLWRLAPWTRAPLLGLRQPAAVLAVLVTSAILACAVASAPLFLSSARSAALQQQLAGQCAEAGWGRTGFGVRLLDAVTEAARGGSAVLIATHDELAWARADRVLSMRDGVVTRGAPA